MLELVSWSWRLVFFQWFHTQRRLALRLSGCRHRGCFPSSSSLSSLHPCSECCVDVGARRGEARRGSGLAPCNDPAVVCLPAEALRWPASVISPSCFLSSLFKKSSSRPHHTFITHPFLSPQPPFLHSLSLSSLCLWSVLISLAPSAPISCHSTFSPPPPPPTASLSHLPLILLGVMQDKDIGITYGRVVMAARHLNPFI